VRHRDLAKLEPLAERLRRRAYLYIARQRRPVGRDEIAAAFGIPRSLAAFHLDKLVTSGLLEAKYGRLSSRTGPGAGRPSKLYRPSTGRIEVTVPPRRYELLARVLLRAVGKERPPGVGRTARSIGRELGSEARKRLRRSNRRSARRTICVALGEMGYEPFSAGPGTIRLANCPFHELVSEQGGFLCETNLALLRGALEALPEAQLEAQLDARPETCCVLLRDRGRATRIALSQRSRSRSASARSR
jgi:predicted ArsR family transcriptional regulator